MHSAKRWDARQTADALNKGAQPETPHSKVAPTCQPQASHGPSPNHASRDAQARHRQPTVRSVREGQAETSRRQQHKSCVPRRLAEVACSGCLSGKLRQPSRPCSPANGALGGGGVPKYLCAQVVGTQQSADGSTDSDCCGTHRQQPCKQTATITSKGQWKKTGSQVGLFACSCRCVISC